MSLRRDAAKRLSADVWSRLSAAEAQYKVECQQREAKAEAHNQQLDQLISNLAFDVESAIHEYIGIVLSNSAIPRCVPGQPRPRVRPIQP